MTASYYRKTLKNHSPSIVGINLALKENDSEL